MLESSGIPLSRYIISTAVIQFSALTNVLQALVSEGASVVVVRRPESSAKSAPAGAKVISVSLTDVPALGAALKEEKIEVVVSTVGTPGLPNQRLLGDAAKLAGVKLFVPSEFGFATYGQTEGELGLKARFGEYLKEIGLPSARIFVSYFLCNHITCTHPVFSDWRLYDLRALVD